MSHASRATLFLLPVDEDAILSTEEQVLLAEPPPLQAR